MGRALSCAQPGWCCWRERRRRRRPGAAKAAQDHTEGGWWWWMWMYISLGIAPLFQGAVSHRAARDKPPPPASRFLVDAAPESRTDARYSPLLPRRHRRRRARWEHDFIEGGTVHSTQNIFYIQFFYLNKKTNLYRKWTLEKGVMVDARWFSLLWINCCFN